MPEKARKAKWANKKRGRQPTEWVEVAAFGRDSTLTNVKR